MIVWEKGKKKISFSPIDGGSAPSQVARLSSKEKKNR